MDKPQPKSRTPLLDYHEVINFIEEKYKINTRDYLGLFGNKNTISHFQKYQNETGDIQPNDGYYPDVSGNYRKEWQEEGYEGWTIVRNGERIKATKEEYDAD